LSTSKIAFVGREYSAMQTVADDTVFAAEISLRAKLKFPQNLQSITGSTKKRPQTHRKI